MTLCHCLVQTVIAVWWRWAQDAVARSAKFWVFYKRAGQRVLINDRGDMLVRPTFTELSIQQLPLGSSVFHVSTHLLAVCVVLVLASFG